MTKYVLIGGLLLLPTALRAQTGMLAASVYHLIKGTSIEDARAQEVRPAFTLDWPADASTPRERQRQIVPILTESKHNAIKLSRRVDAHPDSADLYRRRGILNELVNFEQAVAALTTARAKGSIHPEFDYELAQAYLQLGALTKAQASAAEYQKNFPADVRPWLLRATADLRRTKGDHGAHCRAALVALKQAWALDSTNFTSRLLRAYALTATNQFAAGIADYEWALARAPQNTQVHFLLAEAHVGAGNLTAACTHFAQAEAYAPKTVKAYQKAYCR